MKLTATERHILSFLIYPESFHQLLEESGLQRGSLRADLMHLVSHGYIEVYLADQETLVSPFYDTDNMEQFSYKATRTGINAIRQYAV
ncbi:MAG: hypothetical protein WDZ36_01800 [Balneolaceae bacterium]